MKTTSPAASPRNVLIMRVSLLITASYWWLLHQHIASAQALHGYEGEGAFTIVLLLHLLL